MMAKFVCVVGRQRSGTTVFRQLLESQGGYDANEIFHQEFWCSDINFFGFFSKKVEQDRKFLHPVFHRDLFVEFLDHLERSINSDFIIIDIKYNALRLLDIGSIYDVVPFIIEEISRRDHFFFHVFRRNKLRSFVSEYLAQKTGIWGQACSSDKISAAEKVIELDYEQAIHQIACDEKFQAKVSKWLSASSCHAEIAYEDMFGEEGDFSAAARSAVAAVFSVPDSALKFDRVSLVKQNPEALGKLIANFPDVKARLAATPYAWMTDA